MGESLDDWRDFFGTMDMFAFIDTAITIAATDRPGDFRLQRGRILERLFSTTSMPSRCLGCDDLPSSRGHADDSLRAGKESKRIDDNGRGGLKRDRGDMNPESYLDCGGAKAFSDEIDEQSQVVGEVLRIKQVLDNSQRESDSALYESLSKLQLMTISKDILEKTKIGITVNSLRRKCGSRQIVQLAHDITMGWKAMVEEICRGTKDIAGKLGEMYGADRPTSSVKNKNNTIHNKEKHSKEASLISEKNHMPNMNQHQATVKPIMSSCTNSRKIPAREIATWKFEKEEMLQKSNGIVGRKRISTDQPIKINCVDEVTEEEKFKSSKRNTQEHYRQAETAKRQRIMLALPAQPKQLASLKGPASRTRIEKTLSQMAKSRSRISSF